MLVKNINCKYYGSMVDPNVSYGKCHHPKQKKSLWLFKIECVLISNHNIKCKLQKMYPKPKGLPPAPPPCRIFKECLFGGLVETKESKQRTNNWRNGFE